MSERNGFFEAERITPKSIFIVIVVASFLQWMFYQLLLSAKIGFNAECFAFAQIFVVLLTSPYLTAISFREESRHVDSGIMLVLSSASVGKRILRNLIISLLPIFAWILLSSGFATIVIGMPIVKVLNMIVVLTLFSFAAGAVGLCGARAFRDTLFGTLFTYLLLGVLISSAFLIKPLERYINDLQPIFGPILHLNPVIAVCTIFDGLDVLRNPLFYELTPITSQDYTYPAWYMNILWQLVIGACSLLWTWWMCRPTKPVSHGVVLKFC